MLAEKTFADLNPRDVIHIHCGCGRDRLLMPITLLSEGKVRGKTTIWSLEATTALPELRRQAQHSVCR